MNPSKKITNDILLSFEDKKMFPLPNDSDTDRAYLTGWNHALKLAAGIAKEKLQEARDDKRG